MRLHGQLAGCLFPNDFPQKPYLTDHQRIGFFSFPPPASQGHSYEPSVGVKTQTVDGNWQMNAVEPGRMAALGLLVY